MGMTRDGLSHWQAETTSTLLETTVGALLDQRAAEIPTRNAIVYSCYPEFGGALDIRWTYQEFRDYANAVARGLIAFDSLKMMQVISVNHCTVTGAVPTMLLAILQHPDFDRYDLSSIRAIVSGGASVLVYVME